MTSISVLVHGLTALWLYSFKFLIELSEETNSFWKDWSKSDILDG